MEIENIEVFLDAGRCNGLRDDDITSLDVPAQNDLRDRLAVLLRDGFQRGVFQNFTLTEWAPGFCCDVVFAVEQTQLVLLELWMQFNLIENWRNTAFLDDAFEIGCTEVGYTNGFGTAFLFQFDGIGQWMR